MRLLTRERLIELLSFEPETGLFRWRKTIAKGKAGAVAGRINDEGYVVIGLDGERYLAHRLVFLWAHGRLPNGAIDHVDGNPSNNRPANIREATASQNRCNARRQRVNTSRFKGATFNRAAQKWKAQVKFNGQARFLGYFDTPEEAHAAYWAVAQEMQGQFARKA